MENTKVLNEKETIEQLIVDTKNQMSRFKVQERYFQRQILKGKHKDQLMMQTAQTQAQIRGLEEYLEFLEEVLKEKENEKTV